MIVQYPLQSGWNRTDECWAVNYETELFLSPGILRLQYDTRGGGGEEEEEGSWEAIPIGNKGDFVGSSITVT